MTESHSSIFTLQASNFCEVVKEDAGRSTQSSHTEQEARGGRDGHVCNYGLPRWHL